MASTAPCKKEVGRLYVGSKTSKNYKILEFTSNDDVASIAKEFYGLPLVVQSNFSNVPHTMMNSELASDPAGGNRSRWDARRGNLFGRSRSVSNWNACLGANTLLAFDNLRLSKLCRFMERHRCVETKGVATC